MLIGRRKHEVVLALGLMFFSCESNPTFSIVTEDIRIDISKTIVRPDTMRLGDGFGLYYKTAYWNGNFSPNAGDSVVQILLDSNFVLAEFWYPYVQSICLDPLQHEREIARLLKPDTTIFRLGYQPLSPGYDDVCIVYWWHYKITRIRGGA